MGWTDEEICDWILEALSVDEMSGPILDGQLNGWAWNEPYPEEW
jgi:hypothetical protein